MDPISAKPPPNLLRLGEVAELLRRSEKYVRQLQLKRRLAYYSLHPVMFAEEDVAVYIASAKVRRVRKKSGVNKFEFISAKAKPHPRPFKLLTDPEAAETFKTSVRKIRYLCQSGHTPYLRGRPRLIDEVDLAAYFESRRVTTSAKTPGTVEYAAEQEQLQLKKMRDRHQLNALKRKVRAIMDELEAQEMEARLKKND